MLKDVVWLEDIKKILLESIYKNDSKQLKSIITSQPLIYYFWEKFAENFMQQRKEKGIFLKSLRLTHKVFDIPAHQDYSWYLKQTQHINAHENFTFSWVLLYDNTVIICYFDDTLKHCQCSTDTKVYNYYLSIFNTYWIN